MTGPAAPADSCPRCYRTGYCFCRGGPPATVHRGDAWPPRLQRGKLPGVQPCRTCGAGALYDFTIQNWQACSAPCLRAQGCSEPDVNRLIILART